MSDSAFVKNVTDTTFDQEVLQASHQVPVLVDFWAEWCGPCQMLMPVLVKLTNDYHGKFLLAKVNTDEQQALAARFGVRSLPTVKIFRNGEIVDEFLGAQPEASLRHIIDKYLERVSDKLRIQALEVSDQGNYDMALDLLRQAAEMEPDHFPVRLDQARIMIRAKQYDSARQILNSMPVDVGISSEAKKLMAELEFAQVAMTDRDINALQKMIQNNPDNLQARYELSACNVINGDYEAAMEQLLEIMRRDRSFHEDAGRKGLLSIFDMMGGSGEIVSHYRAKLSSILY